MPATSRAIIHVDADAFFASVEQALTPALRGKPLVTGRERGIVACANYAAKAADVKRGVPLGMARQLCPELVILPSDYESYSQFSERIFNIMRTFTPIVEEYSIDEAFADITGMDRVWHASYEDIARRLKAAIQDQLGITVSLGVSTSKTLAKLCSKHQKPDGFTPGWRREAPGLLAATPLHQVWGFGPSSVAKLRAQGLATALDYTRRPAAWASKLLHTPGRDLWYELSGESVWPVNPQEKSTYATLIKSKTFAPPSRNRDLIFAKLVRNLEAVLAKARRHRLRPGLLAVVLRRQDFFHDGAEAGVHPPTAATLEILPLVRRLFDDTVRPGVDYRATMIILGALEPDRTTQYDFFEDRARRAQVRELTHAVDSINARFGSHTVASGSALDMRRKPHHRRDDIPDRHRNLLPGETLLQRLGIPRLEVRV